LGLKLNENGASFQTPLQSKFMEGETSIRKGYQEGKMGTASEKVFMQKMLKCVKAQAEFLKKILSHLSEIKKEEAGKTQD